MKKVVDLEHKMMPAEKVKITMTTRSFVFSYDSNLKKQKHRIIKFELSIWFKVFK